MEGAAFDKRFLELMIEHHRGAIHMADQAVAHAVDDDVVDLARLVKRDQESEIAEFLSFLKRYPG